MPAALPGANELVPFRVEHDGVRPVAGLVRGDRFLQTARA